MFALREACLLRRDPQDTLEPWNPFLFLSLRERRGGFAPHKEQHEYSMHESQNLCDACVHSLVAVSEGMVIYKRCCGVHFVVCASYFVADPAYLKEFCCEERAALQQNNGLKRERKQSVKICLQNRKLIRTRSADIRTVPQLDSRYSSAEQTKQLRAVALRRVLQEGLDATKLHS